MINELIDKQDTFEIVRDKIAQILADESANQVALATAAGKPDPTDWALSVYTERSAPWDDAQDNEVIVNVWFESANVDRAASDTVERQAMQGMFNIDIVGTGVSRPDGAGHDPGDEVASRVAQRGLRLCRNILMAAEYTYLDLRPLVGRRMPESITAFQPPSQDGGARRSVGNRLVLGVRFAEYSPQVQAGQLEQLYVDLTRAEDGRVLATLQYDYTA